jgi:hypothetical protein
MPTGPALREIAARSAYEQAHPGEHWEDLPEQEKNTWREQQRPPHAAVPPPASPDRSR